MLGRGERVTSQGGRGSGLGRWWSAEQCWWTEMVCSQCGLDIGLAALGPGSGSEGRGLKDVPRCTQWGCHFLRKGRLGVGNRLEETKFHSQTWTYWGTRGAMA